MGGSWSDESDTPNLNLRDFLPWSKYEISVQHGSQATKYEVTYQTTVKDLKQMIEGNQGLKEDEMDLQYNDKILREHMSISNHPQPRCAKEYEVILLDKREIIVKHGKEEFMYEVDYRTTVKELKRMIASKQDFDEDEIDLYTVTYYKGRPYTCGILTDERMLMRNDVLRYDSVYPEVTLIKRIYDVFVKHGSHAANYEVTCWMTVKELRQMIADTRDMHESEMDLQLNGKILDGGNILMQHPKLCLETHREVIALDRREIFVKYGKKMTKYEITYQTTVRELKEMVAEELGMEAKMILNYDTKILDDDVVLMKQDELRLDTYPLLVLSEIVEKEDLVDFMDKYNEMLEKLQDVSDVPLTEEEENWVRLSFLLIDEGTVWVAKIIRDFLLEHDLDLKTFLDSNRKKLEQNCKHDFSENSGKGSNLKGKRQHANVEKRQFNTRPLTYEQFKVLYPDEPEELSLDNIDMTLLILINGILILRDAPPSGWCSKSEPDEKDEDKASDLKRMRMMRNDLYAHIVECTIPTPEFEKHWDQLVKILQRLGATITELDKIKQREFTKEDRKRCAKRITTLFMGDMLDAEEFAQEKMKELIQVHKPKNPQQKNIKQILSKCHTEVLSAVDRDDEADFWWSHTSAMRLRKVLFACEECHRFSPEEPKVPEDRQNPQWWTNHCRVCRGEILRREIFIQHRSQKTQYEVTYQTTVQALKEILARENGMKTENVNLYYKGRLLARGHDVLMNDYSMRFDTFPVVELIHGCSGEDSSKDDK